MVEASVKPKGAPVNRCVKTVYHETDKAGKGGILKSDGGFLPGNDGLNGHGIYFPEDVDQAMTHSRHDAEFLFEVFLDAQSDTVVASGEYSRELEYTDWSLSRAKTANKAKKAVFQKELDEEVFSRGLDEELKEVLDEELAEVELLYGSAGSDVSRWRRPPRSRHRVPVRGISQHPVGYDRGLW